jgi:hypothetical protein
MDPNPLHIFLDTCVLTRDPKRDTAAFRALERLAQKGSVTIHVSDVTVREFVSQEEGQFEKLVNQLQNTLRDIQRRIPPGEALGKRIASIRTSIQSLGEGLDIIAKNALPDWMNRVKAKVYGQRPDDGKRVLESYFHGNPPFKTKKNRADFPDAFIFECLKEIASSTGTVHAVISDVLLRESASKLPGVTVYEDLDSLIMAQVLQELIRTGNVEENMALLCTYLHDDYSVLGSILKDRWVDAIAGKEIESAAIPDDNNVATIGMVGEPDDISYRTDDIEYYGDGSFRVPFEASAEVLADYYIFKSDYYCMNEKRAEQISIEDWNDHYYAAEEYFTIRVHGSLSLSLGEDLICEEVLDERRLRSALSKAEGEIDEIESIDVIWPSEDDF